ncbi:MAG: MATE family efflux transporter [Oscillospiraceae bacterium]|nr:MATE family efflux transporter [Oscillospiraceae bacterium]
MKTKVLTSGRPSRLLLRFALPLMAGNMFQELYTITDTVIVGRFLGVNALAAVGIGAWVTWMLMSAIQGVNQGFSVSAANSFGGGDIAQLKKNMGNSAVLSLTVSILVLIVGQACLVPLLKLLDTPAEIFDTALLYLRIFCAGCPVMAVYNYAACHLRALGNSTSPLRAMIIASITNIVLDLLFVGPFKWGVAGAIIATVIAQGVAAVYSVRCLLKIDFLRFKKSDFIPDMQLCKSLLMLGVPMSMQNIIISVGGLIVQMVVNRYGITFIAGVTATNRLYGLLETAAVSYGYAVTTFTGQNNGAGEYKRIRQGVRAGCAIGTITSAIICAVMLIFGKNILSLFISGSAEEVAATLEVAWKYLFVMSVCLPVLYILHALRSAIVGLENSIIPLLSGILELILRVSISFIFPALWGAESIFLAEPLAWLGGMLMLLAGYIWCVKTKLNKGAQK